jgi:sulfur carrier protein
MTSAASDSFIIVFVNGAPRTLQPAVTLSDVIAELGLAGKRIAVERNGAIVPRSLHADTRLSSGDRLEIVAAVGGG